VPGYWQMMRRFIAIVAIVLFLGFSLKVYAYSVLAHEAIIDSAWDTKIRPLLLERFPNATPDELRRAHAFAYGGAIVQDLGYYPHGSHYFSDLVHYVRSGDFIRTLLLDSQDLNEYAFALGALAHYAADDDGHRLAVNRAVPLLYPRLGKKYGDFVTYEDDPAAHLKTEFGFDVLEVAKGRYAPDSYHDFIGFEVARPLLQRAFEDTYSIPLQSAFDDLDQAIGSYRYSVRSVIPKATKIAWALKKGEIRRDLPGVTRKKFLYNLSRASYQKEWGKDYRKPGPEERFLAFLISLIPKVGPLQALAFRTPTPQTETMFMASFNAALADYQHLLDEQRAGHLDLPNRNFDTGSVTPPGTYFKADQTYARLLDGLAKDQFKLISAELRSDILAYYRDSSAPIVTKKKEQEWARVTKELEELKSVAPSLPLTSDAESPN
jgi:Zinc dependent phospholipase C